jgi:Chaperone of endosialidase
MLIPNNFRLETMQIGNLTANGAIGTAANTIDKVAAFVVNQTTANITITIPNPTINKAGYVAFVTNGGSVAFTMHGVVVNPGKCGIFMWRTSTWIGIAAGSSAEATPTALGTVRYADNASTLAGTGNRVVTDSTLKNALSAQQAYNIDIRANGYTIVGRTQDSSGYAIYGESNGNGAGGGVYGAVNGTGNGIGVYGAVNGTGNGSGVYGFINGTGNGSGAVGRAGWVASSTGNGSAVYGDTGGNGTRLAVAQFHRAGANTTWGLYTNAGIFTAGGVTTSDKRVKENIGGINVNNAIKFLEGIRFVQYDKLMDKSGIVAMQERQNKQGRDGIEQVKAKLEQLKFDEDGDGKLSKEERQVRKEARGLEREKVQSELKQHEELANMVLPTDSKSMFVAKQAGLIAQELQELTAKIGDFEWLVTLSNPHDKESILVVDYTSLAMILEFANREKSNRLEARIAKLEIK